MIGHRAIGCRAMAKYGFLTLGLMALVLAGPAGAGGIHTKTYRFGAWHVKLTQDNFAGSATCRLKGNNVLLAGGVLNFKFDPGTDTQAALFRIDSGKTQSAADYIRDMKSDMIYYTPGPLEDPGVGRVRLPLKLFTGAAAVDIRPNTHRRIKHFRIDGLDRAVAFMAEQNCLPPVAS